MKLRAQHVRRLTHLLPLPGRALRWLIKKLEPHLLYPQRPVRIKARFGKNEFIVRDFSEFGQRNVYFLGYHEFRESRLLTRVLVRGDVFVDAGANQGWFTLLGARLVGDTGRVVSFEPSSVARRLLAENVALNGLANVTIEPLGLAERNRTVELRSGADSAKSTILPAAIVDNSGVQMSTSEQIHTTSLDEYLEAAGLKQIKLVKIDVEGAEALVVAGMTRLLSNRRVGNLLIEVDRRRLALNGYSLSVVLDPLKAAGYRLYRVTMKGLAPLEPRSLERDAQWSCNVFARADPEPQN